ncbi:Hypothetical_protein [Hexamita inflata]|uniref:Hypothetical_protein n=1 Tax=Hexamita inflata TaxID=28002 RepID=A0AA86R1J6_9EUKA|nr:Hypothetical protein HINF_LOCUS57619 [Hexamita inflata]
MTSGELIFSSRRSSSRVSITLSASNVVRRNGRFTAANTKMWQRVFIRIFLNTKCQTNICVRLTCDDRRRTETSNVTGRVGCDVPDVNGVNNLQLTRRYITQASTVS